MNPDEFEQYLGLRGSDTSPFATEPRKISAIDQMLAGTLTGVVEDSYGNEGPIEESKDENKYPAGGPNSMFDSFDQEEKRLVEELAASEKARK